MTPKPMKPKKAWALVRKNRLRQLFFEKEVTKKQLEDFVATVSLGERIAHVVITEAVR